MESVEKGLQSWTQYTSPAEFILDEAHMFQSEQDPCLRQMKTFARTVQDANMLVIFATCEAPALAEWLKAECVGSCQMK